MLRKGNRRNPTSTLRSPTLRSLLPTPPASTGGQLRTEESPAELHPCRGAVSAFAGKASEGSGGARTYSIPRKSCRPEQKLMRAGGQWDLAAKSLQRTRRPIRGGGRRGAPYNGSASPPPPLVPHPRPPLPAVQRVKGEKLGKGSRSLLVLLIRRRQRDNMHISVRGCNSLHPSKPFSGDPVQFSMSGRPQETSSVFGE